MPETCRPGRLPAARWGQRALPPYARTVWPTRPLVGASGLDILVWSTHRVARGWPEVALGYGGGDLRVIAQEMSCTPAGVLDRLLNLLERTKVRL
jgi:hypothetical protein